MEVILKKDVEKLGEYGDIKIVKDGYARNFLIPKGLAVQSTEKEKEIIEKEKDKYLKEKDLKKAGNEKIKDELEKLTLEFKVKAIGGKMFGSVTSQDVAVQIFEKTNKRLEKKAIELSPIHELGKYEAIVKLGDGIKAKVKLEVLTEEVKKNDKA